MTEFVIHVAGELRAGDLEQLRATLSSLAPVLMDPGDFIVLLIG
jgi:hypothetical protein